MNKVFKASIIAATLAAAFGAQAADIQIDNKLNITKEAAKSGYTAAAYAAEITFYNRQELSAGDVVTLTFPIGTVFNLTPVVVTGSGVGKFEFAPADISLGTETVAPTMKFTVATGSPVLNNSKTVIKIADFLPKAGNAVYTAADGFSGVAKDTTGSNSVALTTSSDQEVVTVKTPFDGYIDRVKRDTFVTTKGQLVAEVSVSRPVVASASNIVAVPAPAVGSELLVLTSKSFANLTSLNAVTCNDGSAVNFVTTSGNPVPSCTTGALVPVVPATFTCSDALAVPACKDTATIDTKTLVLADATSPATGKSGSFYIYGVSAANKDIPVTTFTVSRAVTYTKSGKVSTDQKFDYLKDSAFGEYQLDASVVNVPYLPVGLNLTPNVEIANAGTTDAEIQIEAFDQNGKAYGPVLLAKKAGKGAVTKVSEADIEAAFALGKASGKKLSVTFVIDADADDITLAPYYRDGASRVNVISDQYKK